jgi:hypothetical protein
MQETPLTQSAPTRSHTGVAIPDSPGRCEARPVFEYSLIFLAVLCLRIPFVSLPDFADGPAHLRAISNGTYLIQPPGYWLFNRLAGLFSNPAHGISALNIVFAAAGAVASSTPSPAD